MRWRVEDEGGSEGRPVTVRTGVEPPGEITPRESGPTSLGCLRTRPSEQLAWEAEQMTAACLPVRPPACSARQPRTSIVQVVCLHPTGSREGPWERLERHKPKGLRVVLRGLGSSNAPRLPGRAHHMAKGDRWSDDPDVKVREMRNAKTVLGVISERETVCQECHEAIHRERPKRHPFKA